MGSGMEVDFGFWGVFFLFLMRWGRREMGDGEIGRWGDREMGDGEIWGWRMERWGIMVVIVIVIERA